MFNKLLTYLLPLLDRSSVIAFICYILTLPVDSALISPVKLPQKQHTLYLLLDASSNISTSHSASTPKVFKVFLQLTHYIHFYDSYAPLIRL